MKRSSVVSFAIFTAVATAAAILFFSDQSYQSDRTYESDQTRQNVLPVVLSVEGKEYELSLPQGSTALQLMEAAKLQGFSFSGREFTGMGFFVEEINGKKQNPRQNMYWIYSINGKKAEVGVSNYIIQPNDVISWDYETGY